MIFWLSSLLLATSALFGGGTRAGFLGDVVVQFLAIPLLLAIGWRSAEAEYPKPMHFGRSEYPLGLAAIAFSVMLLVQLFPLPVDVWADWLAAVPAHLSRSGEVSRGWRGLSLTPAASWAAAISLLPPLAVFLAVSRLDALSRLKLVALVIALGAVGLLIGFLQVVQGPQSGLRFFEFTNPSEAVGFFANRNHFAASLYTALVFAGLWFTFTAKATVRFTALQTSAILWLATAAVLLVAIIAGIALARSRAGVVLTCGAVAGIMAMVFVDRRTSRSAGRTDRPVRRLVVAGLAFAILFAAQFGVHRVLTRFETDPFGDLRMALTPVTLRMARESLPFGTGLGSFAPVYATVERNTDLFAGYANRAHNDWAEFLLEGGVFAATVLLLFLWWFGKKAVAAWRLGKRDTPRQDAMLQRAATIVIALLLVHSFVDYPLRTTAMGVVFAFACALLIAPPRSEMPVEEAPPRGGVRRRAERSRSQPERWGSDLNWPEAWKRGA
jgi:O-antigen ligase